MIPNSQTTAPVFIEIEPDWSVPFTVWQKWETYIQTAWNGVEQRAARRHRPLYDIAYTSGAFTADEWPVRRANLLAEYEGPVVVPLWAHADRLSSIVDDVVTLMVESLVRSPFKPSSYAYFVREGLPSTFRLIEAVGNTSLTLAAEVAWPYIMPPAYPAGTLVYPCVFGIRRENRGEWSHQQLDATVEQIYVEEL